jgi:hypothetical protein
MHGEFDCTLGRGAIFLCRPKHIVQFYDDDVFLTESVVSFIKVGLKVNDTLFIIATAAHRTDLHKALTPSELANKHLIFFDADSLLLKIMLDDRPNQSMFMEVLGNRIQQAGQRRRIRVFGEMVSVLWAEGKHQAAIRLEELWNTLQTVQPVSILHAYPHSTFTTTEDPQSLLAVYYAHTEVYHQKASA